MVKAKMLFHNLVRPLLDVYGEDEARSMVFLWMNHFLHLDKMDIMLNKPLPDGYPKEEFRAITARLLQHEPIQYILGETEFMDRRFLVNPAVLIPRPETEELVYWLVKEYQSSSRPLRILDIGTGSGCIAISLAKALPRAIVSAWDVSEEALQVARKNAEINEASVAFAQVDILQPESWPVGEPFDLVVSNPPYVTRTESGLMRPNVLNYEPHLALFVADQRPLLFY
jgi:release factor glutamine methyltransferase